ncbi:MAG: M17 family peptidase N-terminal domain-containing protein, partial [Myxococcota bacterium]
MQVTIESGFRDKAQCELLAVPLPALDPARWRLPRALQALDRAAGGRIAQAVGAGDFRGKRGESLLLHPAPELGAKRVLLIGLGPEASLDSNGLRELGGAVVREARGRRAARAILLAP